MNCLSCKDNFKFYEKSTNCLNCEKYVNYLQTECISEVPEGYYIENENLGTLGKCHELCKTCEKGVAMIEGELHMNCKVLNLLLVYLQVLQFINIFPFSTVDFLSQVLHKS